MSAAVARPGLAPFHMAVKTARLDGKFSRRDLARRIGQSERWVEDLENGEVVPDAATFKRLRGCARPFYALYLYEEWLVSARKETLLESEGKPPLAKVAPKDGFRFSGAMSMVASGAAQDADPGPPKIERPAFDTFGEALRWERELEDMEASKVGELCGVTHSAVSAWESNRAVPVRENFDKLLALFPALADAPTPAVRNIPKPPGQTYSAYAEDQEPTVSQPTKTSPNFFPPSPASGPMAVPAAPLAAPPPGAAPAMNLRQLLTLRRLMLDAKTSPHSESWVTLLRAAAHENLSALDVLELLSLD